MPQLAAAIAAGVSINWAATIVVNLFLVALMALSVQISKSLQKKPVKGRDPGTALDATVSSAPPRLVIYGEVHVGGARTLIAAGENPAGLTGNIEVKNEMLHVINTFTGHPIRQFKGVFLGDYPIWRTHLVKADGTDIDLAPTGNLGSAFEPDTPYMEEMWTVTQGRYAQYIRAMNRPEFNFNGPRYPVWSVPVAIGFSLGDESTTTQPFPYLSTVLPEMWAANARQIGCSKLFMQFMYNRDRFPNGLPNISSLIRGKLCKDPRDGADFDAITAIYTRNPAVIALDFLLTEVDEGGFGARQAEIDFDSFESAANICDEFIDIDSSTHSGYTAEICNQDAGPIIYPRVITEDPPDTSRQLGRHKNTILLDEVGTPIRFSSGDRVRVEVISGTLPTGLTAGTDYYIAVLEPWPAPAERKRLLHEAYVDFGQPVSYPVNDQPDGLDDTKGQWFYPRVAFHTTYAAAVDELPATRVAITAIGTGQFRVFKNGEPRYTCDYSYTVDETKRETLENISSSMAGDLIYSGGKWICKAGAYETPSVSLEEDDCAGLLSVQTSASMRDNFNAVTGLFTLAFESKGEAITYPLVQSSTALAEDGGDEVTAGLDLPATTRINMAQRIAQIKLLDSRQQIVWEQDFKFKAYQLRAGDFFYYSNERMEWTNKVFRVLKWERQSAEENGVIKVTFRLSAKETAAEVYEADPALLDADDPAINTELPSAFEVGEPENLAVEEFKRNPSGNIVEAVQRLTWDSPWDSFVELYEIQWKKADTDTETYYYDQGVRQREAVLELINLEAPLSWNFRVRSVNHLGVVSEWVEIEQEITGLSDRPSDPESLQVVALGGMAYLTWPMAVDIDVIFGGTVVIRHSSSGTIWSTALGIQPLSVFGNSISAQCPLLAGYYMIKFIDSTGNECINPAIAYTAQTSTVAYTNEWTIRENSTFTGTKTYCNVNGSNELTLDTASSIVEPEGLYEFDLGEYSGAIDSRPGNVDDWADWDATGLVYLAAGGTRRVTAVREATVDSIATTMDSRTGLVDTWTDWDNVSGSEADAWVEARICTEVNPFLLTATWSDWFRADSAELFYYGLGLRAQLRSYDPQGQIEIQVLGANVDAPA